MILHYVIVQPSRIKFRDNEKTIQNFRKLGSPTYFATHNNVSGYFTDKKAWMRWALTVDNGFPFTSTVNVSSFSVVIKLPNHDRFVNSGDESGVK